MASSVAGTDLAAAVPAFGTFAEAYHEYAPRVARWAARLGGCSVDVEDIVQEVFLLVSRKWSTLRADGNFTSWLFQVTRKIVANQRRRARWRRLWSAGDELLSVRSDGPDPDAELDRRLTLALFHRAVDRLPEKQRTVFVLFELEGMSTAAIAELTQRNLSTVKVQLARARQRFAEVYRRLLRRECEGKEIELGQLADRVVKAAPLSAPRLGKKTS